VRPIWAKFALFFQPQIEFDEFGYVFFMKLVDQNNKKSTSTENRDKKWLRTGITVPENWLGSRDPGFRDPGIANYTCHKLLIGNA
jgi:hypothetical protein